MQSHHSLQSNAVLFKPQRIRGQAYWVDNEKA